MPVPPPSDESVTAVIAYLPLGEFLFSAIGGGVTSLFGIWLMGRKWGQRETLLEAKLENLALADTGLKDANAALKAAQVASDETQAAKIEALQSRMSTFQEQIHAFRNDIQGKLGQKPDTEKVERMIERSEKNLGDKIDALTESLGWLRDLITRNPNALIPGTNHHAPR